MKTFNCDDFKWQKLIESIKEKKIIPIIGKGFFYIESKKDEETLLYDFLARKVAEFYGFAYNTDSYNKFADTCFNFFKKNKYNYTELSSILKIILDSTKLISLNPIWKLAHIKNFDIFMTLTYDDLLAKTINDVREVIKIRIETLSYTVSQKKLHLLDEKLFDDLENSRCSLVYHLLGHYRDLEPAYIEKNINETILQFRDDMKRNPGNHLSRKLTNSCLLFLGCDTRLLKSLIPALYEMCHYSANQLSPIFIGGVTESKGKTAVDNLSNFLQGYEVEAIYSCDSKVFIDRLIKKLVTEHRGVLIPSAKLIERESRTPPYSETKRTLSYENSKEKYLELPGWREGRQV